MINNNIPTSTILQNENSNGLSPKKKVIVFVILGVVLAMLLSVLVYFFIIKSSTSNFVSPLSNGNSTTATNKRTIENPLTGELYTESDATSWVNTRPLGVMINNHLDARPQSGLVDADVVYELVAEGGITRFLTFFLSNTPEKIGPIRSTRTYYLTIVKEMGDAMLMHEGYSPQALEAIDTWPVRSLQRGGASELANWRDTSLNVATEHTLYTNGKLLRERGNVLGWQGTSEEFESWMFKEDSALPALDSCMVGDCNPITIDFWFEGDYSAIWKWNKETNAYLRFTGYDETGNPVPHVDRETKAQIKVKNVIVQFATESNIAGDDKNRLEYELLGSGSGLVFMDGAVTKITWAKKDRDSRTFFYDENGNEIKFNRGKFWISIVPDRNLDQVKY